jgi:hypothetical protein
MQSLAPAAAATPAECQMPTQTVAANTNLITGSPLALPFPESEPDA